MSETQCAGGECKHRSTCRKAQDPVLDVRPRIEPKAEASECGKYEPVRIVPLKLEGLK